MKKYTVLLSILLLLISLILVSCATSDDGDGSSSSEIQSSEAAEFLTVAPVLDMDINEDTISSESDSTELSTQLQSREAPAISNPSQGGCLAWGVRKNAIVAASVIQELSCTYNIVADQAADYITEGTTYLKFTGYNEGELRARISLEDNIATINVCMPHVSGELATTENARLTAEKSGDGYVITGIWNTEYPESDTTTRQYFEEILDTSSAGVEISSYFSYFVNDTYTATDASYDVCTGSSGTDRDASDDTCFLSLQGDFVNNTEDPNSPYSTMSGTFAEKNNAGVQTVASVHAHYQNGQGETIYSSAHPSVNSDVNSGTVTEAWTPNGFSKNTGGDTSNVVGQVLPERRVLLPTLDDAWDCEASGDFISVPYSTLPDLSSCQTNNMQDADITSCTDPAELDDELGNYLCDPNDPLITVDPNCS